MRWEKLPAQNALCSQATARGRIDGPSKMEAVYRQARAVLDKAAAATNKDQKTAQISLLVELCAYRGDSALVAEVVEGVAGYAADRSAKVPRRMAADVRVATAPTPSTSASGMLLVQPLAFVSTWRLPFVLECSTVHDSWSFDAFAPQVTCERAAEIRELLVSYVPLALGSKRRR